MIEDALYSLDNGMTRTQFAIGEFYEVPGFVAQAMLARNWAVLGNPDEAPIAGGVKEPEEPAPAPPAPVPEQPEEPEPLQTGTTYKMKVTTAEKGKRHA